MAPEASPPDASLALEVRAWAEGHGVACVSPGDADYGQRRLVYNRIHDPRPAALLLPNGADQVRLAVSYAAGLGVPMALRGGGHHVAGFGSCDGVVIDLGRMTRVELSQDGRVASVQGGARLRHVDAALCERGLVVPTGTVSDTGIAGLALGGGIGWLVGRLGLTCDNLVGADLVLADGSTLQAESSGAEDLLWALRGGGGGFGAVTQFRFRTHALPRCTVGSALVPLADARAALERTVDFLSSCPEELTVAPLLCSAADGAPVLSVDFCLLGADDETLAGLLRAVGAASVEVRAGASFARWQQNTDSLFLEPLRGYWKAAYVPALTAGDLDAVLDAFARRPTRTCAVLIEHLHGAFHRVSPAASAFPLRWARYGVLFSARWQDAALDQECASWARQAVASVDPRGTSGSYSNYSLADEARVAQDLARRDESRERLLRVKRRYDPRNLFARNHLSALLNGAPAPSRVGERPLEAAPATTALE